MYSLKKKKKKTLLVIDTALNTKPTWASHIPTEEDPDKCKADSPAPSPCQPHSPLVLAHVNQRPSAPAGSAGHAGPWHRHRMCPLRPSPPAERGPP